MDSLWTICEISAVEKQKIALTKATSSEKIILSRFGIEIRGAQLKRLTPNQPDTDSYLNGDIINMQLHMMWDVNENCFHMDSMLVEQLVDMDDSTYNYQKLKRCFYFFCFDVND